MSPFNAQVNYVKPRKDGRHGFFEVRVDDYYENMEDIDCALKSLLDEYNLFFDDDSDADFDLGAAWDE